MVRRAAQIQPRLAALDELLGGIRTSRSIAGAIARWRAGAGALQFHLQPSPGTPAIVVILGGTGTGKSTLVNRMLGSTVTAASFKRTFTAGAIAIATDRGSIPAGFLGLPHAIATDIPARGEPEKLAVIEHPSDLTGRATLIDTPDLDGDQPAHHAQADRAFRWAQAVVFLVTPEKYQMTELLPYYRLAQRYAAPALFVMNKVEEQQPVEDYIQQLAAHGYEHPRVFAIARDDAAFQPEGDANVAALAQKLQNLPAPSDDQRASGIANRCADLVDRLHDQIFSPLESERREADRLIEALRAMEAPQPGVDVNPLTRQLARRLQQRSILYLMGPQRILERVRQVPSLLVRLPRTAWDWMITGKANLAALNEIAGGDGREVPDFRGALIDQFTILQTRIDDTLRSSDTAQHWLEEHRDAYRRTTLDAARAGTIVDEELAELNHWLSKRWNATPRDTALLLKLIRHLPGGQKLTQWSEAAPYLLAVIIATHHAFFGHIDLMILGGYSFATWLTERLSNEVAARTRLANKRIAMRFERLAHEQIRAACDWLEAQTPSRDTIGKIGTLADALSPESYGPGT